MQLDVVRNSPELPYVLFVDDEDSGRKAARLIARGLDYNMLTVGSAEDALVVLADDRYNSIGLVVTDYCLDGSMNGAELARRVREMYPSKISACYTGSDLWRRHARRFDFYISKPVREVFGLFEAFGLIVNGRIDEARKLDVWDAVMDRSQVDESAN